MAQGRLSKMVPETKPLESWPADWQAQDSVKSQQHKHGQTPGQRISPIKHCGGKEEMGRQSFSATLTATQHQLESVLPAPSGLLPTSSVRH